VRVKSRGGGPIPRIPSSTEAGKLASASTQGKNKGVTFRSTTSRLAESIKPSVSFDSYGPSLGSPTLSLHILKGWLLSTPSSFSRRHQRAAATLNFPCVLRLLSPFPLTAQLIGGL